MHFNIRHHTLYRYSHPVRLSPQRLRFHPRDDGAQWVSDHQISITPTPVGRNDHLDLEGNRVTQIWFEEETDRFEIDVTMQVKTLRHNAFNFLLVPEAAVLPIRHEQDIICARAYLERIDPDDAVTAFAAELSVTVNRDTLRFLDHLNRQQLTKRSRLKIESGI